MSSSAAPHQRVIRAAAVVSVATLVSRVMGYFRDMVVAAYFGAGLAADAFFVAFSLPNTFRRLFAEGALSSAYIPVLSQKRGEKDTIGLWRTANALMGSMGLFLAGLTFIGILLAPGIVSILVPGFFLVPAKAPLTIFLTRLTFPYILLIGLTAVATAVLNTFGRFFAPSVSTALLNMSMIGAVIIFAPRLPIPVTSLAIGVIIGGLLQLLLQIPYLKKVGYPFKPRFDLKDPGLRRILKLLVPATYAMGIYQVNIILDRLMASYLPEGSISFLYFGNRLMQFPLGIFGLAISTAILPTLAQQAGSGNHREYLSTTSAGIKTSLFLSVPATAGLILLARPLVSLLFERGAFTGYHTEQTVQALIFYSLGLAVFSAHKVVLNAYYAVLDITTPALIGTVAVIINVLLNMILMVPLGHGGLALATSLASLFNLVFLALHLRRKSGPMGGWAIAGTGGKIMAATGAMALAVIGAGRWLPTSRTPAGAAGMVFIILIGTAVYGLAAKTLGISELADIKNSLIRKRSQL